MYIIPLFYHTCKKKRPVSKKFFRTTQGDGGRLPLFRSTESCELSGSPRRTVQPGDFHAGDIGHWLRMTSCARTWFSDREMEARCRPRIAIPFSTGCAAPFRGRLFADRRGESPHAVWEGRNGCVNLFTCCEMKQYNRNNVRTHKKSSIIWGIYENAIDNFPI